MERRRAATDETRRRIIEATMAAHAEEGIVATSIQDVARRADVALGTVYRHFPTLEELVGACGKVTFERLELVPPEEAGAFFAGACSRGERIERLVHEVARLYALAAVAFRRVREARDFLPAVRRGHETLEASLDALAAEALRPLGASDDQRATVRALLDVRVWEALVERGLDHEAAERTLRALVLCALQRRGRRR